MRGRLEQRARDIVGGPGCQRADAPLASRLRKAQGAGARICFVLASWASLRLGCSDPSGQKRPYPVSFRSSRPKATLFQVQPETAASSSSLVGKLRLFATDWADQDASQGADFYVLLVSLDLAVFVLLLVQVR